MSGFVGDLSAQQEEALANLKARVADLPEQDDYYFLRWLRARNFDEEKAENIIRKHIIAREKYGADTILTDYTPPEVLQKYFPGGHFGEDKEGHPVWYDNFNYDFRGIHYSVKERDLLRFLVHRCEKLFKICEELSAAKGRHIETVTFVSDYEKLSIQRHYYWPGIQLFRKILTLFEKNYPERVNRLFLINTPSFFPLAFNLIKHFLDQRTRDKISVLGSDWKEVLLEHISPDQLPQAYGGTRCEPDPYCTKYINPGGDVPVEYYLTNQTETNREEMERVVVARGSSHEVHYQVDQPNSILQWEFVTTTYDIGFGCYFKSGKSKETEVIPMKKMKSQIVPESGVHVCSSPGDYVLRFDNSYSWTRSKEVFYTAKLLPPNTILSEATPTQPTGTGSLTTDTGRGKEEEEEREEEEEKEGLFKLPPAVGGKKHV